MQKSLIATVVAAPMSLAPITAFSADLPVVVEPIDYVRICDAYGSGFYFIPGTDTCLKISGRVRADYNVYNGNEATRTFTNIPDSDYRFRARGYIYMDARSATEFGLLRTYTELRFNRDNDSNTGVDLYKAYINWGVLTFGRNESFYEFRDILFSEDQQFEWAISKVETNLLTVNYKFGNGFSAGVSIEDAATRNEAILGGTYAQVEIPDFVARVRAEGDWGKVQLSGATHYVESLGGTTANAFANGRTATRNQDKWGFAVSGAGFFNFDLGGRDVEIGAIASYSQGVINYVGDDIFGGRCFGGCSNNAINARADAVIDTNGNLELADVWAVGGGFGVDVTDKIYFGFNASYLEVDQANIDTFALFNVGGANNSADFDYSNTDVQGYLRYRPVRGLDFGVGVEYKHVDMKADSDLDALSTFFRAQRTF